MASMTQKELLSCKVDFLFKDFPDIKAYFSSLSLPVISEQMTLSELFESIAENTLRDLGVTVENIISVIQNIISENNEEKASFPLENLSITIKGGFDKSGKREDLCLTAKSGDIFAIAGPTGSGKTRFLEDIEYLACGDSPTKRKILVNNHELSEEERDFYENNLCALLSQSMNFVLELSVYDFIKLHIECRKQNLTENEKTSLISKVLECANSLCGEEIKADSRICVLSGGQSRSLMIADVALISNSPVVLIDEPENAGIDKNAILELLSSNGKIVFVSTHDPVIALSCKKRLAIKNGAVASILERTSEEEALLDDLKIQDKKLKEIRNSIREGKHVC